ncbi:MAG: hypothetical protein S4CHLAM45_09940 [Chlamydiales bacterium]|nr:hypothetical protein [Chlamydiales bacterium]MCH9620190.1 hypothetical protein [Chlamydiales bacterium]MCH9623095.1 hypothetical protein [Chlamydiales bacterium]
MSYTYKTTPVKALDAVERWSIISLLSRSFSTAALSANLAAKGAAKVFPYISVLFAPWNLYTALGNFRDRIKQASLSEKLKDKVFWVTSAMGSVGNVFSEMLKPFSGTANLTGFSALPHYTQVFNRIIPAITLGFSALEFTSSTWSLGRTIKAYRQIDQKIEYYKSEEGSREKGLFNLLFKPFHQNFEGLEASEFRAKALKGIRFSLFQQSFCVISSGMAITASILILVSSAHFSTVGSSLLLSSTAISFIPTLVRLYLQEKKEEEIKKVSQA